MGALLVMTGLTVLHRLDQLVRQLAARQLPGAEPHRGSGDAQGPRRRDHAARRAATVTWQAEHGGARSDARRPDHRRLGFSSGGAGIQADLKTFTALGVYGASVLTALTAQNTRGVTAHPSRSRRDFVDPADRAVAGDLRVSAVKTGMLDDRATVLAVVEGVRRHQAVSARRRSGDGRHQRRHAAGAGGGRGVAPRAAAARRHRHAQPAGGSAPARTYPKPPTRRRWRRRRASCWRSAAKAVLLKGGHASGREAVDILVTRDARAGAPGAAAHRHRLTPTAPAAPYRPPSPPAWRAETRFTEAVVSAKRFVHDALNAGAEPQNRGRIGPRRSSAYGAPPPQILSSQGPRRRTCGTAASTPSECDLAHLRATRASVTNLGNAVPRHRFQAPGGASGWRLGAPTRLG